MYYLVSSIIEQLEGELATATAASQEAHNSATHSENIASNKYDTLAVEAAYLAHGLSVRIADLQKSIALYKQFQRPNFNRQSTVQTGALVEIENDKGETQRLFIGPAAGGLSLGEKPNIIQVITPATPLGQALLNKTIDDEFELHIGSLSQYFTLIDIQ